MAACFVVALAACGTTPPAATLTSGADTSGSGDLGNGVSDSQTGSDAATVACKRPSDCAATQSCLAGKCVDTVACTSDKQCNPLDAVCDPQQGHCVACLTGQDCGEGLNCVAKSCIAPGPACTSSKVCGTSGVCSKQLGQCVECESKADCPAGFGCSEALCVPEACAGTGCADAGPTSDVAGPETEPAADTSDAEAEDAAETQPGDTAEVVGDTAGGEVVDATADTAPDTAEVVGDAPSTEVAGADVADVAADSAPDVPACLGGCDDGNPCTTDACAAGVCTHVAVADGTPCAGGACKAGVCGAVGPGGCSTSSPVLWEVDGPDQIGGVRLMAKANGNFVVSASVSSNVMRLMEYAPDGKQLWSTDTPAGSVTISNPMVEAGGNTLILHPSQFDVYDASGAKGPTKMITCAICAGEFFVVQAVTGAPGELLTVGVNKATSSLSLARINANTGAVIQTNDFDSVTKTPDCVVSRASDGSVVVAWFAQSLKVAKFGQDGKTIWPKMGLSVGGNPQSVAVVRATPDGGALLAFGADGKEYLAKLSSTGVVTWQMLFEVPGFQVSWAWDFAVSGNAFVAVSVQGSKSELVAFRGSLENGAIQPTPILSWNVDPKLWAAFDSFVTGASVMAGGGVLTFAGKHNYYMRITRTDWWGNKDCTTSGNCVTMDMATCPYPKTCTAGACK